MLRATNVGIFPARWERTVFSGGNVGNLASNVENELPPFAGEGTDFISSQQVRTDFPETLLFGRIDL